MYVIIYLISASLTGDLGFLGVTAVLQGGRGVDQKIFIYFIANIFLTILLQNLMLVVCSVMEYKYNIFIRIINISSSEKIMQYITNTTTVPKYNYCTLFEYYHNNTQYLCIQHLEMLLKFTRVSIVLYDSIFYVTVNN